MSYGWLTESSFQSKKQQQEIKVDDTMSIEKAKVFLMKEKEKLKEKPNDINDKTLMELPSSTLLSLYSIIKQSNNNTKISQQASVNKDVQEKLSIKESIYEKLATNTELTKEEKEYKKRCLIDFDSKITQLKESKKEEIQSLIDKDYDDMFIFNNDNDENFNNNPNELMTSFEQLKNKKDQERRNRLIRIQKIKNAI